MKAIFAVTALAAAISGQALAADTEATTTFTGSMDAQFVLNMQPDVATYDVDLNDTKDGTNLDDGDNDGYSVTMKTAIVNGPFSASLGLESLEGETAITVGDIVVTDGKLSFGQVGSLMSTDQYVGSINEDMAESKLDVDVGFRYMVSDELTLQLQGEENDAATKTGFAAKYTGSADALSYTVEAEMYASGPGADADVDPAIFAGAGVTYTTDMVKVIAALNHSQPAAVNTTATTEYAVGVESTFGIASVKVSYQDFDTNTDDDAIAKAEVAATFDATTVSTGYKLTLNEVAGGDEVWGKLAYAADSYEASAKAIVGNLDADEADAVKIELRASTVSEIGVTYYAEYDIQSEISNQLAVGAKYSF